MSGLLVDVDDASFAERVLLSKHPVLLDVWDSDTDEFNNDIGVLTDIADEYLSTLIVARISVEHGRDTLQTYQVRGIPMLILFRQGDWVAALAERVDTTEAAREFIEAHL